jgi:hypothetical protein
MSTAAASVDALMFDEASHTYSVEGVPLPSVTQVLEDVGIIDYGFLPREDRERYLRRGSAVHLLTQLDDEDDLDEASIDPAIAGYLEGWRRFRRESGFVPSLIEHRSYNPQYGYAGTLDRTGSLRDSSTVVLLDIKTGTSPYWCRYQLAAYAAFFDGPRKYPRLSVELHDDGTYRIEEFACRDWQADFNVFISALAVWRAKRRH